MKLYVKGRKRGCLYEEVLAVYENVESIEIALNPNLPNIEDIMVVHTTIKEASE